MPVSSASMNPVPGRGRRRPAPGVDLFGAKWAARSAALIPSSRPTRYRRRTLAGFHPIQGTAHRRGHVRRNHGRGRAHAAAGDSVPDTPPQRPARPRWTASHREVSGIDGRPLAAMAPSPRRSSGVKGAALQHARPDPGAKVSTICIQSSSQSRATGVVRAPPENPCPARR